MANRSKWPQEAIDAGADDYAKEHNLEPTDVHGYGVAKSMGCSTSGDFYVKFNDWKVRREAAHPITSVELPDNTFDNFRQRLDEHSAATLMSVKKIVRDTVDTLYRSMELRVAAAERRGASQEDFAALVDSSIRTEELLDDATREGTDLKLQVARLLSEKQELQGRLTQAEANAAEMRTLIVTIGATSSYGRPDRSGPHQQPDFPTAAADSSADAAAERSDELPLLARDKQHFDASGETAA